ncbi:hypothetical protein ABIE86_007246 [Bradyrhizobium diazoefficiens]
MNEPGAPALVSTIASPWPAPLSAGNGLVAAGVEHEDARPRRQRAERVEQVVQPHALERNVGFALGIEIDRHQIVLAVDLKPVAGVEHQRDGVGAAGADLAGEIRDRRAHLVLREVGRCGDGEAGIAEQLGHALGVVGGVGQLRHRAIGGLADHQRKPRFGRGLRRHHQLRERKQAAGKEQITKHWTAHGVTSIGNGRDDVTFSSRPP